MQPIVQRQENVPGMKRKKICPHCGRSLWLSSFYPQKGGGRSSWCKDCQRQSKRDWYAANRKKPDGTHYDRETGRCYVHNGCSKRIMWSRQMLDDLCSMFPTTQNAELAGILGVSQRTMIRKARELGLEKNKAWLLKQWEDNRFLAHCVAKQKGYPGSIKKGEHRGRDNEFKPGHRMTDEEREKQSRSLKASWVKRRFKNIMKKRYGE